VHRLFVFISVDGQPEVASNSHRKLYDCGSISGIALIWAALVKLTRPGCEHCSKAHPDDVKLLPLNTERSVIVRERGNSRGFPVVIMREVTTPMLLAVVMTTLVASNQSRRSHGNLHGVIDDGGKKNRACAWC